jgi:hypothetical protein
MIDERFSLASFEERGGGATESVNVKRNMSLTQNRPRSNVAARQKRL